MSRKGTQRTQRKTDFSALFAFFRGHSPKPPCPPRDSAFSASLRLAGNVSREASGLRRLQPRHRAGEGLGITDNLRADEKRC